MRRGAARWLNPRGRRVGPTRDRRRRVMLTDVADAAGVEFCPARRARRLEEASQGRRCSVGLEAREVPADDLDRGGAAGAPHRGVGRAEHHHARDPEARGLFAGTKSLGRTAGFA